MAHAVTRLPSLVKVKDIEASVSRFAGFDWMGFVATEESVKSMAGVLGFCVGVVVISVLALFSLPAAQDAKFHNAPDSAKDLKNPYQGQMPADAKALYQARCAICHGETGEGTGNIPSLAKGRTQSAADGEVLWYVTKGDVDNGMPSWQGLPQDDAGKS